MKIPIAVAHAHWKPHLGGGNTNLFSENALSATVSALVSGYIRPLGVEPEFIELPEVADGKDFRCNGRHTKIQRCNRYKAGLAWVARECRRIAGRDGLALSFHFGRGKPGWRGPLCLVNAAPLAHSWAKSFLKSFTLYSGVTTRGVWELPKHAKEFPRNPQFVRQGPKNGAVLIEMGNAASAADVDFFDYGYGMETVASAAEMACYSILD